ncbi:SDR family oxidoreductase [Cesiribacter andamanensis]|uniref:Serine 3-dehydrogenase n=1 Tax=Cesiribacter andamanensis AMV16 TaxID=1279009 RepID=M7P253_9BACT|nr:SDR family oxidoreductase [Cesiribacter andamanensis]EMR04654.1 Serine 3-dehydrogenase [Cesiribacter andamanensis AMV16]
MNYILLLGATSDMAFATAKEFAKRGWGLLLAARNQEQLAVLKTDLEARYEVPVYALPFEARQFSSHEAFLAGLPHQPLVTALFFGYLGDQQKAQDDWQESSRIIEANYTGAVSILNLVARQYEQQKQGAIIGVSSVAGERGRKSNYLYGSAKAGLTAYLSGLRNRLQASGVPVITIKPGFVATRMTEHLNLPKPLTASPRQVAEAIYKAYQKKKNVVYVLPVWRLIMQNIRMIPEPVFKKMNL